MTLPSTLLHAMTSTLREKLGAAASEVRMHGGAIGDDPKETITAKDPAVLVAFLGANLSSSYDRQADGVWAAFAMARKPSRLDGVELVPSLVANDLAVAVMSIVEEERWGGLATKRAERVRLQNEYSEELRQKSGWGLASVAWVQSFDIRETELPELYRLGSIHHTILMGDQLTPDVHAVIEFPEPAP